MELTRFRSTRVEGTIDCSRDGLLYTSVPQNGNWYAEVDGKAVQTQLVGDCMLALELTEGTHTIRLTYRNAAFSLGWKVSLACAAVFGALAWSICKPNVRKMRKSGKYQK